MGLFSWIRDLFSGGESPEPPTASPPDGGPADLGTPDDGGFFASEGEQDLPNPAGLPFDFSIAGFLPLDEDFNTGYVDTEGQAVDVTFDIEWADVDYIVVKITEPGEHPYYTTFVGPFDDYDDFYTDLAAWWEEGSV